MTALLQILLSLAPSAPALIQDAVDLIKTLAGKYPGLTSEQVRATIIAVSQQADTSFLTDLAKITADKAAEGK
jgi:hypothetical protein